MKRRLIVFTAFVMLVIPAVASALPPQPGPYASGYIGAVFPMTTDIAASRAWFVRVVNLTSRRFITVMAAATSTTHPAYGICGINRWSVRAG